MDALHPVRLLGGATACGCAIALAMSASAGATGLPARTFDVSSLGVGAGTYSASSADPVISGDGLTVAFDAPVVHTAAYAYLGAQREVYTVNLLTGARTLISGRGGGAPATGGSSAPSISSDGRTIAFVSTDSTLAPGASPSGSNVYVRLPTGQIVLASGAPRGAVANGSASQPALSGNGRYVAFTSTASNLFPHDDNKQTDVFVHDVLAGQTVLVSANAQGSGNGWSSNPSISANGRYVIFDSSAHNLQRSPHNHVPNVYFRDLHTGIDTLVSQSTGGVAQNQAAGTFRQISSISSNGKLVAFDSDATNLVHGDTNRRSDVFLRNIPRHTTQLISVNNAGFEGNSDSFSPAISADGTKVAFESYARNLGGGGGPLENVFVRDLALRTTSVIDVGPQCQSPSRERMKDLLQRPSLSSDGLVAAFESTARELTHDSSSALHAFVRLLNPPDAVWTKAPPPVTHSRRVTAQLHADDPAARGFVCQVNTGAPYSCGSAAVFSGLHRGRNTLMVRAGGPGMLYQPRPLTATVTVR
jgi:Tol biopolymer transport system component